MNWPLTTDQLERVIENVRLIEESKHRTCNMRHGKPRTLDDQPECGKTATHQAFHTCCGERVSYLCAEHADTTHRQRNHMCRNCKHVCQVGVCLHRIITPL